MFELLEVLLLEAIAAVGADVLPHGLIVDIGDLGRQLLKEIKFALFDSTTSSLQFHLLTINSHANLVLSVSKEVELNEDLRVQSNVVLEDEAESAGKGLNARVVVRPVVKAPSVWPVYFPLLIRLDG